MNVYILSLSEISAKYQNLTEVFFKVNADKLSSHCDHVDHYISLEKEFKSVYNLIYNLLKTELFILKKYLKKNLDKEFICSFIIRKTTF
jgi:hypothetical protein